MATNRIQEFLKAMCCGLIVVLIGGIALADSQQSDPEPIRLFRDVPAGRVEHPRPRRVHLAPQHEPANAEEERERGRVGRKLDELTPEKASSLSEDPRLAQKPLSAMDNAVSEKKSPYDRQLRAVSLTGA